MPESALAVTLARQDAEYPVDAQLKAALTQPRNARREWAANRPAIAGVMYAIWRAGAGRNTTIAARADG
ncbi:hypothetical protein ACLB1T_24445 [Escherichia coli]